MKMRLQLDYERTLLAFERAPDKVREAMRRSLKSGVRDIEEYAKSHHGYISRTGLLEREGIITAVDEAKLEGVLSVPLRRDFPYPFYVHKGTKAHDISPRVKRSLRWPMGEEFRFAKKVRHPGTKKDEFLYDAVRAKRVAVQQLFDRNMDKVFKEVGLT